MRNVYTVRQVNAYIKNMFAQDFMLNRIYIKGEVSNCKYHTSGHIYFSLKDESGTIACVMFAGQRSGLSFRMQEGQQVIAMGSVSVYERDGRYQLYAKEIILDGAGLLYEKFQALKAELLEMGMFAPEYKKAVPKYARTVGVVTAPTGAAIRDIINISRRRNPYVQIILYPALVQGEGAVSSIVKGIHMLEEKQVDVIIVGRGGGSIEDLWAFNEEAVARAIFECGIPVISAVGHETDTTIADYVADLRAPTPSAAAELAVYEYREVREQMELLAGKMRRSMGQMLHLKRLKLEKYQTRLGYLSPAGKLREYRQRAADYEERLPQLFAELFKTKKDKYRELELALQELMKDRIKENRQLLAILIERMKGLSPLRKLNQGFAYVQNAEGKTVKTTEDVKRKETLTVYVADGAIESVITDIRKEEYHGGE
ncbi:exodeoxyribonuclease VII large subunit [Bariatricus massiliensis]|uniref:Exodeoxyribonuclease 7 large subunit n=1 Tax=Bariatricus massiliensis TaxID=1745713 RepID=A0ABS8DD30_9FIRM|nr:exodeoxyribonuclease VII large subunit [Bariatricus massiliensis]MCB7303519.1 exodeoxyribonuclease VII large subunit [Bariatricus massiliensis]MCB7373651.1 exodeoxyribonuclease VII large subunit [Bariatricus massiliensis]MCB7386321.1 exodeoxyribonuclease VII large subunit [Bariatricus massiliensis]MCB7410483.1 exodeoxyribonuclease VII large subunit [Bariatricus massiliensis]MCQ5252233.1 exodeoxyribonuclease VII large subunit [Bariatricus massiliensis]